MRPRVFPAEDDTGETHAAFVEREKGFNEAAGIPRGRRSDTHSGGPVSAALQ